MAHEQVLNTWILHHEKISFRHLNAPIIKQFRVFLIWKVFYICTWLIIKMYKASFRIKPRYTPVYGCATTGTKSQSVLTQNITCSYSRLYFWLFLYRISLVWGWWTYLKHLTVPLLNVFKGGLLCRLHTCVHIIEKHGNDKKHQEAKPARHTSRFAGLWTGLNTLHGFGDWRAWPRRTLIGRASWADNGPSK